MPFCAFWESCCYQNSYRSESFLVGKLLTLVLDNFRFAELADKPKPPDPKAGKKGSYFFSIPENIVYRVLQKVFELSSLTYN